jgi:hypothetical protein
MKKLIIFWLILTSTITFLEEITGNQLLEKAIEFHDQNGNWKLFQVNFLF